MDGWNDQETDGRYQLVGRDSGPVSTRMDAMARLRRRG